MTRRLLAALLLVPACSWELPSPDLARDVAARDALDATVDVPARDVFDAGARDTAAPRDVFDAPDAFDVVDVRDAADVRDAPDVRDVADAPAARDVVLPDGACLPAMTRACYTGNPDDVGVGYCRAGTQSCAPSGTWATRCDAEIRRDCTNRMCGTDGCEGSCGECSGGRACDPTGACVVTVCGGANFTVPCGVGRCPANSGCTADGRCVCGTGYQARVCSGDRCPPEGCTGFDWWCAPAPFCGGGAILCPGSYLCPRWSLCDTTNRACLCMPGFTATRCDGVPCSACPGTAYECTPTR